MAKLSIIIPAYNEEEHIESVVTSLVEVCERIAREAGLKEVELIVVNDGSTDRTGSILHGLEARLPGSFHVVTHEMNFGYGAALKTGFLRASGEYLSFMDADGTIDPLAFIGLYKALVGANADMVVGTRFCARDSEMPWLRKLGNRFFALLLSFLSGQRVRDTASGMRLFRKGIMDLLLPLPDGLHFTPAMSTKALHERLKIVEIPIPYRERSGESKLSVLRDGFRFLKIILGTVLMYNPFKVFLLVGLIFEIVAAGLVSEPIYDRLSGEAIRFSDYIYRGIGSLYFFTIGVQIILFGVLARFIVSCFFRNYESGVLVHLLNRVFRVYDWMGLYGLGVFLVGTVINGLYFWRYLFKGGLNLHWSWLLLAAGFIIVGMQMIITGVLMKILKDIKAATITEGSAGIDS